MKDLMIEALDNAYILLEKQVPQTKKKSEFVSILNTRPMDLISFIKDNNVPDDCCFGGKDNGDDGWEDIGLCWDIDVPTTEKDRLNYKRKRFDDIAFKFVYNLLTSNGYKRVGFNSGLLKQFDDTTVYDMYMEKNFDRLEKYYSLRFGK